MESVMGAELHARTAIVLRPPGRVRRSNPHRGLLDDLGFGLIEQPGLNAVHVAVGEGCRVGLLLIDDEEDLANIDRCEPYLCIRKIMWVGLITRALVGHPRVLQLIGEHLFNFIQVPGNAAHIGLMVRHAWGMARARDSQDRRHDPVHEVADQELVGKSAQMQRLLAKIRKVARSDASVLVSGASGTGKEMVARALHRYSSRRDGPFVAVNCGAIAPQLFQSELFGYEKGAFTGAQQRRIGRIESAHGGTLFLDEIGDMPFDMQVNLLRFLQEKSIERVGGSETIPVDVHVIAATHVDLAEAVLKGRFREDLYYRINVVCIQMPALSERVEDVEELALHYFRRFSTHNKSLRGFSAAAIDAMLRHPWPGNVRELVNRVKRATVMAEGRYIMPEDLGFERSPGESLALSLDDARAAAERVLIERALAQARHRISHAADLLGISRVKLYRLMEKYHMRVEQHAAPAALLNKLNSARPDYKHP